MDGTLTSANDFPTDYDCIMDYLSTHKPTYVTKQGLLWARLTPMNNPHRRALELNRLRMDYHIRFSQPSNDLNVYPGSSQDTMDYNIVWDPVNNSVAMTMFSPVRMEFITIDLIDHHAYTLCDQKYLYTYEAGVKSVIEEAMDLRYTMLKGLGEGGFGLVEMAKSKTDGKIWAVKTFKGRSPEKAKLYHEIHSMKQVLGHPNVVKLFEFIVHTDHSLYLVMEYAGNISLEVHMRKVLWKLPHSRAAELKTRIITHQICLALTHVHSHGIIHRDLKSNNVIVTSEDPLQVKVIDFGLAVKKPEEASDRRLTDYQLPPCGSAHYAAPEMVRQEGFDERSDSWSVGAMVFYMLYKKKYVKVVDEKQPLWKKIHQRGLDVVSLDNKNCGVTVLGRNFIKMLLEYAPEDRLSLTEAVDHRWLASLVPRRSSRLANRSSAKPPNRESLGHVDRQAGKAKTARLQVHPYSHDRC